MISVFESMDKCCGCGACAQACSHNAITMSEDENGFIYPKINTKLCVDCGLCVKTCNHKPVEAHDIFGVYAAQRRSDEIKESASGGIFAELALQVINEGGIVYGCGYEKIAGQLTPVIQKAESREHLNPLLGSKYVQSRTLNTYKEVRQQLKNGRLVLYSGLPCQIAGLKGFLNKDYESLLTIDVICHGTPNEKYFQGFINHLEQKVKGTINWFNFRSKRLGWGDFSYTYTYTYTLPTSEVKVAYGDMKKSVYYKMFLASSIYRESCYHCPFASVNRISDITIGDCWGIHKEHPAFDKEKSGKLDFKAGVSCVLLNSAKGAGYFANHKKEFNTEIVTLDEVVKYNHQLSRPSFDVPQRISYYKGSLRKACGKISVKCLSLPYDKALASIEDNLSVSDNG